MSKKKVLKTTKSPKNKIILVMICAAFVIGLFLFATRKTDVDKISMSYDEVFDNEVLKTNVRTSFKQNYELKDYSIYGESMIFYEEPYALNGIDGLLGKSIVLRNVLNDEESIFSFTGGIDSGIDVGLLDEGLYEIYVYDHYKKKRVFFDSEFTSEQFVTMRRNGKVKMVTLNTQKDYLENIGIQLDQNYAFLTITENTAIASIYDVVIDPSCYVIDISTNNIDYGITNGEFKENEASYDLALKLKEYFEKKGLRVLITREKEEAKAYYGMSGRAGVAYDSKAKLYISLHAYQDASMKSAYFVTSPYTNGSLVNEVAYYMQQKKLILEPVSFDDKLQTGVMFDEYHQEYDDAMGYYIDTDYELRPEIRETGGKLTEAGTMSVAQENQMYQNEYGLYAFDFYYVNAFNTECISTYQATEDVLARRLVEGVCQYYQINTK